MISALQSTSGPLTDVENSVHKTSHRCIIGDAIHPQTRTKLTKNAVLNLALYCGAIWRHGEKPQHWCTTTDHHAYNCSKKILENLPPVGLWCAQTCSFRAVFGLPIRTLTLADSARLRRAENFLYRCTSTYSALNYCSGIFFQISQLSIRSGAHNFSADFWIFQNAESLSKSAYKRQGNACSN